MSDRDRSRTADDAAKAIFDLLKQAKKPKPSFLGTSTATGDEGPSAFGNPMTAAGDLIVGGEGGAPTRRAAGTNGYVLTMVSGLPQWAADTGGGGGPGGGQYRFPLYTTYGGGDLLYDTDGHLMFVLEDLE